MLKTFFCLLVLCIPVPYHCDNKVYCIATEHVYKENYFNSDRNGLVIATLRKTKATKSASEWQLVVITRGKSIKGELPDMIEVEEATLDNMHLFMRTYEDFFVAYRHKSGHMGFIHYRLTLNPNGTPKELTQKGFSQMDDIDVWKVTNGPGWDKFYDAVTCNFITMNSFSAKKFEDCELWCKVEKLGFMDTVFSFLTGLFDFYNVKQKETCVCDSVTEKCEKFIYKNIAAPYHFSYCMWYHGGGSDFIYEADKLFGEKPSAFYLSYDKILRFEEYKTVCLYATHWDRQLQIYDMRWGDNKKDKEMDKKCDKKAINNQYPNNDKSLQILFTKDTTVSPIRTSASKNTKITTKNMTTTSAIMTTFSTTMRTSSTTMRTFSAITKMTFVEVTTVDDDLLDCPESALLAFLSVMAGILNVGLLTLFVAFANFAKKGRQRRNEKKQQLRDSTLLSGHEL